MRGSLKENRDYLKYLHRRTGVGADQGQLEEELRLRTGIGLGPVSLWISPAAKTSSLTALPELCGLCLRSFWWVRGRVREQDIMNVMVIFDMSIGLLCSRVKIVSEVLTFSKWLPGGLSPCMQMSLFDYNSDYFPGVLIFFSFNDCGGCHVLLAGRCHSWLSRKFRNSRFLGLLSLWF